MDSSIEQLVPSAHQADLVEEHRQLEARLRVAWASARALKCEESLNPLQLRQLGRLTNRIETWHRRVAMIEAELSMR